MAHLHSNSHDQHQQQQLQHQLQHQQNHHFYTRVRENIVALLLYLVTFTIAHLYLSRIRPHLKKNDTSTTTTTTTTATLDNTTRKHIHNNENKSYSTEDDTSAPYYSTGVLPLLPNLLCSAALAVALFSFILPPATVLWAGGGTQHTTSPPDVPRKDWLQWLDASLLRRLWRYTFHAIHLSLFVLIPFAFFYTEADTVRGAVAKARESALITSLTAMLAYAFIYVLKQLLEANDVSDMAVLELVNVSASALFCLAMVPKGFMAVFSAVKTLPLRPSYRRQLTERLTQLQFEKEVLRQTWDSLEASLSSPDFDKAAKTSAVDEFERLRDRESESFGPINTAKHQRNNGQNTIFGPQHLERRQSRNARHRGRVDTTPGSSPRLRSSSWAGRDSPISLRSMRRRSADRNTDREALEARRKMVEKASQELEAERSETQKNLGRSPLRRNVAFLVLLFLTGVAWCVFVVTITFSLVRGLLPNTASFGDLFHGGLLFNTTISKEPHLTTPQNSSLGDTTSAETIDLRSSDATRKLSTQFSSSLALLLGSEVPILETILILYLSISAVAGVLKSSRLASLRPRRHRTGPRELLAFIAVLLFVASSLPSVIRILGLSTSLPISWEFENVAASFGGKYWLTFAYRFVMLCRTTYSMVDLMIVARLTRH